MAVDDAAGDRSGTATQTCFAHPGRETGRRCTRCGRPACSDCLRQASVGAHCVQCVRDAAPPRSEVRRVRRVLGDHPLWVTKGLVAVNIAVFLVGVALDGGTAARIGRLTLEYGLFGPAVDEAGEWYRVVTSGFLHSGLMHVALNMFVLWFLGRMIEPALGGPRFGLLYAAGLAGGSAGALLVDPTAITVGASGAIYGLLGAAFVGLRARGVDPFQAGIGGLLVIGLLTTFAIPGISVGGHLGGLVAGAAVGYLLLAPALERRQVLAVSASATLAVAALAGSVAVAGL